MTLIFMMKLNHKEEHNMQTLEDYKEQIETLNKDKLFDLQILYLSYKDYGPLVGSREIPDWIVKKSLSPAQLYLQLEQIIKSEDYNIGKIQIVKSKCDNQFTGPKLEIV